MTFAIEKSVRTVLEEAVSAGMTPGAVCEISIRGIPLPPVAVGSLATLDASGTPIAVAQREDVHVNTRYDVASITKLFTALTILGLVDDGRLDLDEPVGRWLTDYQPGHKSSVTLRHLLTHTSGLPDVWPGWHAYVVGEGTEEARWLPRDREAVQSAILALPLDAVAGSTYVYSCLGYITAMACAESATGKQWSRLVDEKVTQPLELEQTGFGPVESAAPTEYEPHIGRGLVRGVVHDETAYALEGISGNAGLFSTTADLRRLGDSMVGGLVELLSDDAAREFWDDQLPHVLRGGDRPDWGQGVGPRIGQDSWMSPELGAARGHTGFTGPSLLVERDRELVIALVTNRVHPSRETSDGNAIRLLVSRAVIAADDA